MLVACRVTGLSALEGHYAGQRAPAIGPAHRAELADQNKRRSDLEAGPTTPEPTSPSGHESRTRSTRAGPRFRVRRRLRGWRGLNYGDGTATVEIIPLARPGLTAWSASRSQMRLMTRSAPSFRSAPLAMRTKPTSAASV
jgi:hypothetical protein